MMYVPQSNQIWSFNVQVIMLHSLCATTVIENPIKKKYADQNANSSFCNFTFCIFRVFRANKKLKLPAFLQQFL